MAQIIREMAHVRFQSRAMGGVDGYQNLLGMFFLDRVDALCLVYYVKGRHILETMI